MQRRKLFTEEEPKEPIKEDQPEPPIEPSVQIDSPSPASPEMRTPQSIRKQSSNSHILETCERSPYSTFGSPSSVLNPPPSLKRKTILDYFVAPST
uniref:Uncharacterized protein n=1 Tax=Tanacetum cinerariifolium TaxID=118510 RepID=A0A699SH76_TANCI|nr:hypothetical protein [Tanacetum cinerariifolium]GFC96657.1 hypothetical protein [Tanacetum cinerariifolium]